ncbi:MAG: hypothetical protein AB8H79_01775 [Myxococcota bacterium]
MQDHPPGFVSTQVRFGWIALAIYLCIGLILEALHGFKVAWYLDVGSETRRLLLTLGHAHGTLLALVNLVFAATSPWLAPGVAVKTSAIALRIATVLLPAGFLLGGLWLSGNDPGVAVFLVPLGGIALMVGVIAAAVATR